MARFTGVNHLAFVTGDMDKTVRFWRDLLGMRLVATIGEQGFRHYFFELSETDTVAFFEWDGAEPAPQKRHGVAFRGPIVFDHVAFGVESVDELWELKDKLMAADYEVSGPIDHGFIHSIYAFDPNGIPVEFSYNVPGYRHPPDAALWRHPARRHSPGGTGTPTRQMASRSPDLLRPNAGQSRKGRGVR